MSEELQYEKSCGAVVFCQKGEDIKYFGQTAFSEEEVKRLRWYDIILYLTMMIEVFYREFDDKGQYFWAREMLTKTFE